MLEDTEPWLIEYVQDLRGDIALDVGANVGDWTVFLAERFQTVIAYEPHPEAFDELERNTEGVANTVLVPVAVAHYVGSLELNVFQNHSHTSAYEAGHPSFEPWRSKATNKKLISNCLTLDSHVNLEQRVVGFIKVDVEGMELEVMKGAELVTAKHRPVWLIECHSGENLEAAEAMLVSGGYKVTNIHHPNTPHIHHGWLLGKALE